MEDLRLLVLLVEKYNYRGLFDSQLWEDYQNIYRRSLMVAGLGVETQQDQRYKSFIDVLVNLFDGIAQVLQAVHGVKKGKIKSLFKKKEDKKNQEIMGMPGGKAVRIRSNF